jgi:hypothetical protein
VSDCRGGSDTEPPVRLASAAETEKESVSVVVVSLLAEVTNQSPSELDALNDTVDTDALDSIFADRSDGRPRSGGVLVFRSNGCEVSVDGDGAVVVRALE